MLPLSVARGNKPLFYRMLIILAPLFDIKMIYDYIVLIESYLIIYGFQQCSINFRMAVSGLIRRHTHNKVALMIWPILAPTPILYLACTTPGRPLIFSISVI
jgi:hypothetical protein